ncbi:DUF6894 family protein [Methylobacterium sp. P31]
MLPSPKGRDLGREMPRRFYFDLENGQETIRDDVGVLADDMEHALTEAQAAISETIDEGLANDPGVTWVLVVRDAKGWVVARLSVEKSDPRSSRSKQSSGVRKNKRVR